MARKKRTPSYRHHRASGQAFVEFDGRRVYLGRHGSEESRERYHALIAEWLANGKRLPVRAAEITVSQLILRSQLPIRCAGASRCLRFAVAAAAALGYQHNAS